MLIMLSRMLISFLWTLLVLTIFESTRANPVRETEELPRMTPDEETGIRVSQWTKESNVNPEELGRYLEGDIMVTNSIERNGIRGDNYRWQGGVIPLMPFNNNFDSNQQNIIHSAIADIQKYTCIKFKWRGNEKDYIRIDSNNTGCWSYVGRIGGAQAVNLQKPGCVYYKGTVMHELSHAIGFWHEQTREDRDGWVDINYPNIQNDAKHNFDKRPSGSTDSYGVQYDYGSIMHYGAYAFAIDEKVKTIITKNPANSQIGQRDGLSQSDITKIQSMYKGICNNGK